MGTGEDVLFKNIGTKIYTRLILDANCYCYFPLFIHKYKMKVIFWSLSSHAFSLFSLG